MSRFLCSALLTAALSFTLATARAQDDKNKCTIAIKGDGDVKKACDAGGIKRAKAVMKAQVKLGKDKGIKHECDDCHKDEANGNWALTKDGQEKFDKLLAAIK